MNIQPHQPLVSVMIPYYNCQDYIAETIESVEKQTYSNVEIIIVNDGSAQEHTDYLKQLLINKPHIQYYFQQNKGVGGARNLAAQYAKGIYFLFLDADDVILPTYITQAVDFLENNPQYKLVYPMAEYFGEKTGIWELPPYINLRNLLITNHLPSSIAIHRAEDFHRIGGFDDSLSTHEDWDYWICLLVQGGGVHRIPEVLFRYRKRYDKSSLIDMLSSNSDLNRKNWQKVYNKHQELMLGYHLGYVDLVTQLNNLQDMVGKYQNNECQINQLSNELNRLRQEKQNLQFQLTKIQLYYGLNHSIENENRVNSFIIITGRDRLQALYQSPSYQVIRFFKRLNWKLRKRPKKTYYYPSSDEDCMNEVFKILSSVEWNILAPIHAIYLLFKKN